MKEKGLGKRLLSFALMLTLIMTLMPVMSLMWRMDSEAASHNHEGWMEVMTLDELLHPDSQKSKEGYLTGNTYNIYLGADIELDIEESTGWEISGDGSSGPIINLCLNGYSIGVVYGVGRNSFIEVKDGATLKIYDCKSTGTISPEGRDEVSAVTVENGNFYLYEGIITDTFSWDYGGGVKLLGNSTFVMEGGSICYNVAGDAGGGVYVGGTSTFLMKGGRISNNEATVIGGGGVYVDENCTFTMSNGSITDNFTWNAGAGTFVNYGGDFAVSGGNITGNEAGNAGGGVYVMPGSRFGATGGSITGNVAGNAGAGVYLAMENDPLDDSACLSTGTPITLADGTRTAIDNLREGDEIMVFDHETGTLSSSKVFRFFKFPEKRGDVFTLHFTHDINVTVVGAHCFFDRAANKYVNIAKENAESFIGHEFYNADNAGWETLLSIDFLSEKVDTYYIVSDKNLNALANGMLSNTDGFYAALCNIFELDGNLKIDPVKKAADIEKYGLCQYNREDLGELIDIFTKESYEAHNLQYLKVALGKGVMTQEDIDKEAIEFAKKYLTKKIASNPMAGENITENTPRKDTVRLYGATGQFLPEISLGGSIVITGNVGDNLFIWNDSGSPKVTVTSPVGTMRVGVTVRSPYDRNQDTTGIFTANGGIYVDSGYFIPDNSDFFVKAHAGRLALALQNDEADEYPIWVQGVKVTDNNLNDVLEDGKVQYDTKTNTLRLNNAGITTTSGSESMGQGIFTEDSLNIELSGNSVIGRERDWPNEETYAVSRGIVATGYDGSASLNFTGSGSLTIYDRVSGIEADNVYFGKEGGFSGTITVRDYGEADYNCAIIANDGGVEIYGGTFDLISLNRNGINAKSIIYIKNADVMVTAGNAGLLSEGMIIFDSYVRIKGGYAAIMANAGENGTVYIGTSQKPVAIKNAKKLTGDGDTEGINLTEGAGTIVGYYDYYYVTHIISADSDADGGYVIIGNKTVQPNNYYFYPYTPEGATISGGETGGENIKAEVSGDSVVISDISPSVIEEVAKFDSAGREIVIDVSNSNTLGGESVNVTLTKTTAENIAKALESRANIKDTLTIKTKGAEIKIDATALSSIASQAESNEIKLVIENTAVGDLNAKQKAAVGNISKEDGKDVIQTFEAYFVSGGKRISNFNGGIVTVGKIDYKIPTGKNPKYYHVYYISEAGVVTRFNTWTDKNTLYFRTPHFSEYVIVYDESVENGRSSLVYRLYNKTTGDHLFTVNAIERDFAIKNGYNYEGIAFYVSDKGKKVYRIFNKTTGEHFYTALEQEKNRLISTGWSDEGVAFMTDGTAELFRLYNGKMHFFTASLGEKAILIKSGWKEETNGFKTQ